MTWTDERVETLKRLWTDGLSASQIAAELGGITRNAVIGKVHRLGLSGRAKSPSSAAPRPRKARPHQHMMRVSRPAVRGNTALAHAYDLDAQAEPELVDNVVPMGQRRTLLELTEETCRWPIGDPGQADFFFCGGRTITTLPYCAFHSRVAYQPPNMRRDRRPFRGLTGPSFVMPGLDPGIHLLCEKASCEDDGLQRTRAARVRNIHCRNSGKPDLRCQARQ